MEIPSPFKVDGEKRLVLRQGGGCLSIFGLPFLAAGIFMLLAATGIVPLQNADDLKGFEFLIFLLMGLVFSGAGASLVFGRKQLIIDLPRGTINETWSLFIPFRNKTARLHDFRSVTLRFKAGDSDTSDSYPLALEARKNSGKFDLASPLNYGEAIKMAVCIADYLSLPFEDLTSATPAVYNPRKATVASDATANGQENKAQPLPARPRAMRSTITDTNGVLEIFIPYPAFADIFVFLFFIVAFILLAVFLTPIGMIIAKNFRNEENAPVLLFSGFAFLVLLNVMIKRISGSGKKSKPGTFIIIDKNGLKLQEKHIGKSISRSLPASDIIAVDFKNFAMENQNIRSFSEQAEAKNPFDPLSMPEFGPARKKLPACTHSMLSLMNGLVLKTANEIIEFGYGLTQEEAKYLSALIASKLGKSK